MKNLYVKKLKEIGMIAYYLLRYRMVNRCLVDALVKCHKYHKFGEPHEEELAYAAMSYCLENEKGLTKIFTLLNLEEYPVSKFKEELQWMDEQVFEKEINSWFEQD